MTKKKNTTAPLKGSGTTTAGVLTLVTGGVGLLAQILAAVHGNQLDAMQTAGSIGAITTGVGLLTAADANQAPAKKAKKK